MAKSDPSFAPPPLQKKESRGYFPRFPVTNEHKYDDNSGGNEHGDDNNDNRGRERGNSWEIFE